MSDDKVVRKFKNPGYEETSANNKKRMWKSLKQILAVERTLPWKEDAVTC